MNKRYKNLRDLQKNREDQALDENLRDEVATKLRFSGSKNWKDHFNDASSSREFWIVVKKL